MGHPSLKLVHFVGKTHGSAPASSNTPSSSGTPQMPLPISPLTLRMLTTFQGIEDVNPIAAEMLNDMAVRILRRSRQSYMAPVFADD